jgi:4-hydroxy-tetrahydrodipicolinate reductase
MGRMIIAAASRYESCRITGAFERPDSPLTGQDAGVLAGIGPLGVPVSGDAAPLLAQADVMVDFTHPGAALRHAELCAGAGVGMVVGTTGLDDRQRELLARAASLIPIVFSPNMSIGVNVAFRIIRQVALALGSDYDVEIVEAHHSLKKDAPSGTAARMLEILTEAKEFPPEAAIHGRRGMVGERPLAEIGVHAVRAGDIVGDHTVLFAGPGERLEITHRAHSRETFARGAVRAALWVAGRKPGLYDMADVLGLG